MSKTTVISTLIFTLLFQVKSQHSINLNFSVEALFPATNRQHLPICKGSIGIFSFTGIKGTGYYFSNCGSSSDTEIKIYDQYGKKLASNDDDGDICEGLGASIAFSCQKTATYYIVFSNAYNKPIGGDETLTFWSTDIKTPEISSLNVIKAGPRNSLSITGNYLQYINHISANTSSGKIKMYNTNPHPYSIHLEVNKLISGAVTISGLYGDLIILQNEIAINKPEIKQIESSKITGIVVLSLSGVGLENVENINYLTVDNKIINSSNFFISDNTIILPLTKTAIISTLTLSGTFGTVLTPLIKIATTIPYPAVVEFEKFPLYTLISVSGKDLADVSLVKVALPTGKIINVEPAYIDHKAEKLMLFVPDSPSGPLTLTGNFGMAVTGPPRSREHPQVTKPTKMIRITPSIQPSTLILGGKMRSQITFKGIQGTTYRFNNLSKQILEIIDESGSLHGLILENRMIEWEPKKTGIYTIAVEDQFKEESQLEFQKLPSVLTTAFKE